MKYLCLGYFEPERFHAVSEEERAAVMRECVPHSDALFATGRVLTEAGLEHPAAVTLRPGRGGTTVTDGPFAGAKEVVGSFFVVEAGSMDEAVRIASMHPAAKLGERFGFGIEVRPIHSFRERGPGRGGADA